MKSYKFLGVLIITSLLLFQFVTMIKADSPTPTPPPPLSKGSAGSAQVQPARVVFDRTTATVTAMEMTTMDWSSAPNLKSSLTLPQVSAASTFIVKYEDFEGAFPNNWEFIDANGPNGGEQLWTDVDCFAHAGYWSGWPAGWDGANGVNPCSPDFAAYPNDVNSWLIYGPFSLVSAESPIFGFYIRMEAELCDPISSCDFLFWGASTDGSDFGGFITSGSRTGSYGNGYDIETLDLSNVPFKGNLIGQPEVWIALQFKSDSSITDSGPFIDDVLLYYETPASAPDSGLVFLPLIIKSPQPVTPKTNLYVYNNTGGQISYYRVFNSKLNGAPIPDVTCTNIPAGATQFCGTLDSDTYRLKFEGQRCSLQATRLLEVGDHTREARCPS